MKKIVFLSFIILIFAFGCVNIPTLPKLIPSDPEGVTKPSPASYTDFDFYLTIDKNPFLVPISVPDYVRLKINIPDVQNLEANELKVFEDDKAQGFLLFKETETRNQVDIMIVLDTTGSMYNAIEGVKNSVQNLIETLQASGLDAKVGIIPFDDAVPSKDITLTPNWLDLSDAGSAKDFVSNITAYGGADFPENPYAGIMYAFNNASWRASSQKIIILITDASAHYKSETYPGDAEGETLYDKDKVIDTIQGFVTVHGAFIPGYYYSSTDSEDFSAPEDPREIVVETGGIINYTDSSGNVDLTNIGLIEYISSSWIVAFESDSPNATHTIEVFIEHDGAKGYKKLENINY
ncbi:von Willebrand factor A [Thermosipho melanesiensis]|uniref:von Willebrand factor, type A n=2 Tax=Thermosipho melanesiensis TaxID=46541 RepID=A6LN45_THEM4|nr:vWA domain-containing protein [Thermosipho melanesiensis]ABR31346.1 von Willebrand factor, type A [Thermosipho melanesiensis BI429]APT74406.1 von Willebrand factor A [Thermosipho melanesiensis]OOC36369.1 von Willebrand factor A [Thermosipho melanesiensis]OOC37187.1 von Willebrand factor A [Thermosipho melanesiensis]OOC37939.1 von Willebrand factor A [Thermosipho melanesiensis]